MGSKIHLMNQQWAFICPLLPPPARTGRPRADDRATVEGILYVLIQWEHLATVYEAFFCVAVLRICLRRLHG